MSPTEVAILATKLEYMNEKVQEIFDMLKNHIEKEEAERKELYWNFDKKYSSKWVEQIVWWAIVMILTSVIWALIVLVVK